MAWWPGVIQPPSNGYLVFTGEVNALSHLAVLGSLWNFEFHDQSLKAKPTLVQANPPGAGLVTRRRTVQVSQREVCLCVCVVCVCVVCVCVVCVCVVCVCVVCVCIVTA